MATPIFIHGKQGTVSFTTGGVTGFFNALDITFEETTTVEDITYTTGGGGATAQIMIPGYRKGTATVTFVYDIANQPTVNPFDLRPGYPLIGNLTQQITVSIFPDGAKQFTFNAYNKSLSFKTGPQAGAVKCTWSGESTGQISEPLTN